VTAVFILDLSAAMILSHSAPDNRHAVKLCIISTRLVRSSTWKSFCDFERIDKIECMRPLWQKVARCCFFEEKG
jgi:hypothetical protein